MWTWDVVHTDTGSRSVVLGTEHPVRLLAVLGALLIWAALRRGSRRATLVWLSVAAAGLPLGSWDGGTHGRVCYLLALLIALAAVVGERPGPPRPGPAGPGFPTARPAGS